MSATTSGVDTAPKTEQAKQAASTAADKAGEVANQASDQVRHVTQEATQQARELADRARQDLREQAQQRSEHVAGSMRTLADRLGSLAEGNTSEAGPLLEYLREGQYRINEWAGRLDEGPDAVFDEMRRFARRKPMMFLAGAGVLGFLAGRMVRSGSGSNGSSGETAYSTSYNTGGATPMPTTPLAEPTPGMPTGAVGSGRTGTATTTSTGMPGTATSMPPSSPDAPFGETPDGTPR